MFKLFLKNKWLVAILVTASLLRFVNLSSNPPSLYWDEASLGYNAFAVLSRGVDEHGVRFPVTHFLAYGDAKPPGYIYATALAMSLFGVNEFAIRFASAFAGVIAVWLTYLLSRRFYGWINLKQITRSMTSHRLSLVSAFLLAISPWHLQMSRAGFEANLALTLFLAGLTALFYAKHKPWLYVIASVFFVSTWYTFNAYRIFLPLFLVVCLLVFFKQLRQQWRYVLAAIVTAVLLTLPLIPFVLSDQAQLRFNEVSIFRDLEPVVDANLRQELNGNSLWSKLLYNRRWLYAELFLQKYFDHFKADFLFFSGDPNPRLGVRDLGVFYLAELPLLLAGIYFLLSVKNWRYKSLLIGWILLAVVPGAVARETPHALRILQILPGPQIIMALGLAGLWTQIGVMVKKRQFWIKTISSMFILLFGFNIAAYLHLYHIHYPRLWADSWQYGYKQMVEYVTQIETDYDRIYITDALGRPHTYVLFYTQYDPIEYVAKRDAGGDAFGFTYTNSFDKYYFTPPPANSGEGQRWLLVSVVRPETDLSNAKKIIYNLKNEPVLYIHE